MANNIKRGKTPQNNGRRISGFVKLDAQLTRVTVSTAGVVTLPSGLNGRCFIEWHPRLDAAGPDKRCFYGNVGVSEQGNILGEKGNKLPRSGKSLNPNGRSFLIFVPGVFKVWEEDKHESNDASRGVQEELDSSVNSDALRNAALLILASGASTARPAGNGRSGFVEPMSVQTTPAKTPYRKKTGPSERDDV
jgi:hypothetical protein